MCPSPLALPSLMPCEAVCSKRHHIGQGKLSLEETPDLLLDFVAYRTLRNTFLFLINYPNCGILFLEQKLSQLFHHVHSLS